MDRDRSQEIKIREQLKEIFAAVFGLDPVPFFPDISTETVENWDSLNHITLIVAIEEEFGVCFAPEEAIELTGSTQLEAAIEAKLTWQNR